MKRNNIVSLLMDKVPRRNKEGYDSVSLNTGAFIVFELEDFSDVYQFLRNHPVFGNIPGRYVDHFVHTMVDNATIHSHNEGGLFGNTTVSYLFKFRIQPKAVLGNGYDTPVASLTRHSKTWLIMVDGKIDQEFSGRARASRTIDQATLHEEGLALPILELGLPSGTDAGNYDHDTHKLRVVQ